MKRRCALLLSITVVLALCAACGVWLHRERRQDARNRQLIAALEHGDTKTALALVNAGADLNTRQFATPAPTLPQLLKQLLHPTPPDNNSPTAFRMTFGAFWSTTPTQPFYVISLDENLPLIQALLAHGANVNAKDSSGCTVLHDAVAYEQLHTVELLLQHGADINGQDLSGRSPLLLTIGNRKPNLAHLLLTHGANPNAQDRLGNTILHTILFDFKYKDLPFEAKYIRLLKELLTHGADPNLPNKQGQTPLMLAKESKRSDLIALLKRGVK